MATQQKVMFSLLIANELLIMTNDLLIVNIYFCNLAGINYIEVHFLYSLFLKMYVDPLKHLEF